MHRTVVSFLLEHAWPLDLDQPLRLLRDQAETAPLGLRRPMHLVHLCTELRDDVLLARRPARHGTHLRELPETRHQRAIIKQLPDIDWLAELGPHPLALLRLHILVRRLLAQIHLLVYQVGRDLTPLRHSLLELRGRLHCLESALLPGQFIVRRGPAMQLQYRQLGCLALGLATPLRELGAVRIEHLQALIACLICELWLGQHQWSLRPCLAIATGFLALSETIVRAGIAPQAVVVVRVGPAPLRLGLNSTLFLQALLDQFTDSAQLLLQVPVVRAVLRYYLVQLFEMF